ncbi:uncharacterized protein LOC100180911 [Ciona intestinalis]
MISRVRVLIILLLCLETNGIIEDHLYVAEHNGRKIGLVMTSQMDRICFVEGIFEIWQPRLDGFGGFKIVGQQTDQALGSSMLIMKDIHGGGIAPPSYGYQKWDDNFSDLEFWFYQLYCPPGYFSLSDFAHQKNKYDWQNDYACVHQDFVGNATIGKKYWDSKNATMGREVDLWSINPQTPTPTTITTHNQTNHVINVTQVPLQDMTSRFFAATHNSDYVTEKFHVLTIKNLSTILPSQTTTPPPSTVVTTRKQTEQNPPETSGATRVTSIVDVINTRNRSFVYTTPPRCIECHPMYADCWWVDDKRVCLCWPGYWYNNNTCKGADSFIDPEMKRLRNSSIVDYIDGYERLASDVRYVHGGVGGVTSWGYVTMNIVSVPMKGDVTDGGMTSMEVNLDCDHLRNYDVHKVQWRTDDVSGDNCSLVAIESSFDMTSQVTMATQVGGTSEYYLINSTWLDVTLLDYVTNDVIPATGVVISYDVSNDVTLQKIEQELYKEHRERYGSFLRTLQRVKRFKYRCVYRDTKRKVWSDEGCRTMSPEGKHSVTCEWSHATMFSVILSVEFLTVSYNLQKFSIVCESLSVASLMATVIILLLVRHNLHSDRTMVQINLSLSVLGLHLFALASTAATTSPAACEVVTVFIHFCLTSSVCWMFVEAFLLYLKTAPGNLRIAAYSESRPGALHRVLYMFGLCFPLVLVIVAASVGFTYDVYMDYSPSYLDALERQRMRNITQGEPPTQDKYQRCWLSVGSKMVLWAAVVPIAVILTINLFILIRTTSLIWKLRQQALSYKPSVKYPSEQRRLSILNMAATARALFLLLPILGIPWVAAFLVNAGQDTEVFMYINAGLNGLQGVFMLVIYCLAKQDVTNALKRRFRRL